MQKYISIGRLTRDPIIIENKDMGYLTLAINEKYKDKSRTTYVPCVIFGNKIEILSKYGKKGRRIYVEGYLSSYIKNYNGEKVNVLNLVVEKFKFLDKYSPRDEKNINEEMFININEEDFDALSLFN